MVHDSDVENQEKAEQIGYKNKAIGESARRPTRSERYEDSNEIHKHGEVITVK